MPGFWLGQWVDASAIHSDKKSKKQVQVGRQNDVFGCGHLGAEELVRHDGETSDNRLEK